MRIAVRMHATDECLHNFLKCSETIQTVSITRDKRKKNKAKSHLNKTKSHMINNLLTFQT